MSKKSTTKLYLLALAIIIITIEPSHTANNKNNAGIAIYLLDKKEEIPSITKKYWAKIKYSYATINSCDHVNDNLNQCVRDELEKIIEIKKYPQKVILITDIRGDKTTNFLKDENITKRVSQFIYFRPKYSKNKILQKSANTSSSIFLVGKNDKKEVIKNSIDAANNLRSEGHNIWTTWLTPYPDKNSHETTILSPQVILLASSMLGTLNNKYQEFLTAERIWQNPPISDKKYFAASKYILSNQIDERFINILRNFYSQTPYQLHEYDLKTYSYFDILNYFSDKQKIAGNNYLKLESRKGRVFEINLDIYLKYKPVIVVAIDGHENLNKIAKFYRTNKSYSWKDEKAARPLFVDALGPFLYFEKEVPEKLQLPLWQYGQIKFEKLELYNKSFVDSLKIPTVRLNSLIRDNCISCHKVFGLGGNAHHVNAINLTKEPGYALPLGDYTKTVMQTFLFDQTKVASVIGVIPNPVHEDTAQELLDYLY